MAEISFRLSSIETVYAFRHGGSGVILRLTNEAPPSEAALPPIALRNRRQPATSESQAMIFDSTTPLNELLARAGFNTRVCDDLGRKHIIASDGRVLFTGTSRETAAWLRAAVTRVQLTPAELASAENGVAVVVRAEGGKHLVAAVRVRDGRVIFAEYEEEDRIDCSCVWHLAHQGWEPAPVAETVAA